MQICIELRKDIPDYNKDIYTVMKYKQNCLNYRRDT